MKEAIALVGMGRQENNIWLKMDGGAADAQLLGGFRDGVILFGHSFVIAENLLDGVFLFAV